MPEARDCWVYELKDGGKIVYYGISCNPERRVPQHRNKRFTHGNVISVGLTRPSALRRETEQIQRYQRQHGGRPPKYNKSKTY
jgi:predicted GIY-YIG superfamily endonuclease